ncbi:MAG: fasciclin domain-containing protein [Microthrixaceae bacterium]
MRFTKVLLVAAVPLALLVSGCSDSKSSGGATTTAAAKATTTAAAADPAAVPPMGSPPSGSTKDLNIAQIAAGTPATQEVTRLVLFAGLAGTLVSPGPFTVFAPTDDAFAKVDPDTLRTVQQNIPQLTTILTQHVVPGTYTTEQLRNAVGTSLTDAAGTKLLIEVKGNDVYVGGAKIVVPDIPASNGVVQVVDTVILKPNGS